MASAAGEANAAFFQEALALLDDFYALEGIDAFDPPAQAGALEPSLATGPLPEPTAWENSHEEAMARMMMSQDAAPRSVSFQSGIVAGKKIFDPNATKALAVPAAYMAPPPMMTSQKAPTDTEPMLPVAAAPPPPPARRNRPREELLRLRGEAVELDARILEMRTRQQRVAEQLRAMSPEELEMMKLWQHVAQRQEGERRRSEAENAKLRNLLATQEQVGQELRRLVEKQLSFQKLLPGFSKDSPGTQKRRRPMHEFHDAAAMHQLIQDATSMVATAEAVLQDCGLNLASSPVTTTQLHSDATNPIGALRVEMRFKKMAPFDVHALGEAMWIHAVQGAIHTDHYQYDEAETEANLIVRWCGLRVSVAEHQSMDLRTRHASRRTVEPDREVITWRGFLEPQEYGGVRMTDIRFQEHGWMVMQRMPGSPEATELRAFQVIAPSFESAASLTSPVPQGTASLPVGADWRVYSLIDFITGIITSHGSIMEQRVENFLLQQNEGGMSKTKANTEIKVERSVEGPLCGPQDVYMDGPSRGQPRYP